MEVLHVPLSTIHSMRMKLCNRICYFVTLSILAYLVYLGQWTSEAPRTQSQSDLEVELPTPWPDFISLEDLASMSPPSPSSSRPPTSTCPALPQRCTLPDIFDEIVVISLPRFTRRWQRVVSQLRQLNISSFKLVQGLDARAEGSAELAKLVLLRDPAPGTFALYQSQIAVLSYFSRLAPGRRALLLEDDDIFDADFPRSFDARIRRLPRNDWQILFLGGLAEESWFYLDPTHNFDTTKPARLQPTARDSHTEIFNLRGHAIPRLYAGAGSVGLTSESALEIRNQMISTRTPIDTNPYDHVLDKWPAQIFLLWPPVIMSTPYTGSNLGHSWRFSPQQHAMANGLDWTMFDLERGYHVGGENGYEIACGTRMGKMLDATSFSSKPRVKNGEECCEACRVDFPRCRGWRYNGSSSTCDLLGTISSSPTFLDAHSHSRDSASGILTQVDAKPTIPWLVHFAPPAGHQIGIWTYLSVLSAALHLKPELGIRWWIREGAVETEQFNTEWGTCVRKLIKGNPQKVPSTANRLSPQLSILIEHGGIYLDTRAIALRSFNVLRSRNTVSLARIPRPDKTNTNAEYDALSDAILVSPRNATFLHALNAHLSSMPAHQLSHSQRSMETFDCARKHPHPVNMLPPSAFWARRQSDIVPLLYDDDCLGEGDSLAVFRFGEVTKDPVSKTRNIQAEVRKVWKGSGSLHRVIRNLLRRSFEAGRLGTCPDVEEVVKRLVAEPEDKVLKTKCQFEY